MLPVRLLSCLVTFLEFIAYVVCTYYVVVENEIGGHLVPNLEIPQDWAHPECDYEIATPASNQAEQEENDFIHFLHLANIHLIILRNISIRMFSITGWNIHILWILVKQDFQEEALNNAVGGFTYKWRMLRPRRFAHFRLKEGRGVIFL